MTTHLVRGCYRCISNCTIHSQHTRPRAETWRSVVHARLSSSFIARGGISELIACSDRASYSRRSFSKDGTSVERPRVGHADWSAWSPTRRRISGKNSADRWEHQCATWHGLACSTRTTEFVGDASKLPIDCVGVDATTGGCSLRLKASASGWMNGRQHQRRDGELRLRTRSRSRHWTCRTSDVVIRTQQPSKQLHW